MQRTIMIPFGMLHHVDTNPFIGKMLQLAKQKNPNFVFTPAIQKACFDASAQFNLGKLSPNGFQQIILSQLGNLDINAEVFWNDWKSMVAVNKEETDRVLADLNEFCADNQSRVVFISDTNWVHLQQLASIYRENGHTVSSTSPHHWMVDNTFYFIPSCDIEKNRFDIIKHVTSMNQGNEFSRQFSVKSPHTDLILGDPANIANPAQRALAEKETQEISTWCHANNVSVTLRKNSTSLIETLNTLVAPKAEEEQRSKPSLAR